MRTYALNHHGRWSRLDLGNEPAIEADGQHHTNFDRRRLSLRWLAGTVLTGLSGAALIGAAIFAALDRQSHFAELPAPALSTKREANSDTGINPRKGDRLVQAVDIVAAKQSFKAPTTVKAGDREVVKVHTFTRVETSLVLTSTAYADDVPPYNPLKLLADARNPIDSPAEPVQDDAEVAWTIRDLPVQNVSASAELSMEEVEAQVAEHIKTATEAGSKPLTLPPQLLLMRTSRRDKPAMLAYAAPGATVAPGILSSEPGAGLEIRMVPENVTNVTRSAQASQSNQPAEQLFLVHHGETLQTILQAAGARIETVRAIYAAFVGKKSEPVVPEGRRLKLGFADLDGTGRFASIVKISVYDDETLETTIALADDGQYLEVKAAPQHQRAMVQADDESDDDSGGMRLYDSFYETALKQEVPRPIIDELVRIFANDVDFQSAVTVGDSFSAFYDETEEGDNHKELLYATITARNETFRYYRFQTPDDGVLDFYDPNGRSTRKFLVRTPILSAKLTSGFGLRFHPILGYTRPHTGVDWAAPIGTPIFAAGNGTIISAGWDSGYGRRIEIQHANGYVTTYNHMSAFAKGAVEGARVRQGQVIGYLGQSGLATGPHLHYEVLVNGHFVDPMKVKLARTREFDGHMLGEFKRAKDRIDTLLAQAPNAEANASDRRIN